MRYPIVIHKDDDSDFGVIVPDIPGCYSAGSSYDEAIDNAIEAVECHLEGLLLDDENIPVSEGLDPHISNPDYKDGLWAFIEVDITKISGKTKRINITMPEKVLSIIDLYTKNHEPKTRSAFLADAALAYINKENSPNRKN